MMARPILLGVLLWFLAAGVARAHDLGAIEAHLTEEGPGRYTLSAVIASALSFVVAPPVLPQRCHPLEAGTTPIRFHFDCGDQPLRDGDQLILPWQREGVLLSMHRQAGPATAAYFIASDGVIQVDLASLRLGSGSVLDAARRYLTLGFEHIMFGTDHLLFVLTLLLIIRSVGALLKTITAFTLAHSLTLGLASFGWVHIPPAPVEAAIALSIIITAAEGLRGGHAVRRPWLMALAFGLLHGFGFAGALSTLGLPQSEIPIALLFFNLGVEAGQLAFVALMLVLGRMIPWPRLLSRVPGYAIGSIAMVWMIERVAVILQG
jgi:hydrogenase/urease accessory protein HupE